MQRAWAGYPPLRAPASLRFLLCRLDPCDKAGQGAQEGIRTSR